MSKPHSVRVNVAKNVQPDHRDDTRRMGLAAGDADLVARFYALGPATGPVRPVARGELGRVWRLPTVGRVVAVKELFVPPTEDEAVADVDFQLGARRAGVLLPLPIRRTDGGVLAILPSGVTVRVYEWMDLRSLEDPAPEPAGQQAAATAAPPGGRRHPDERVGAALARLHPRTRLPGLGTRDVRGVRGVEWIV